MSDPYRQARLNRIRGTTQAPRGTKRGSRRHKQTPSKDGRCVVCGDPCTTYYCHAHSWAEGT